MRKMALDVGDKRIGVAVSDPLDITAQGIETIHRTTNEKDLTHIADLVRQYEVELLILGMPYNMDGSMGFRGQMTLNFAEKLKAYTDVEIAYQDERLSTAAAERVLLMADTRRSKRKMVIDKMAATVILQSYMDSHRR